MLILGAVVNDSKLVFKIQEIPEGRSSRSVSLDADDLDFESLKISKADVEIHFLKTLHFIKVNFTVQAVTILTCDRSLDDFEYDVQGDYEVLFKPQVEEISETESGIVKQFDQRDLTLSVAREVTDTILLGIPAKKLHPRFLDEQGKPVDFETKKFGVNESDDDPVDPRWEKLKKLKS